MLVATIMSNRDGAVTAPCRCQAATASVLDFMSPILSAWSPGSRFSGPGTAVPVTTVHQQDGIYIQLHTTTYGILDYIRYIQLHTDYICYIRAQKKLSYTRITYELYELHMVHTYYIPSMMMVYVAYNYIQLHSDYIRFTYGLLTG